jgi:hypothetical protein
MRGLSASWPIPTLANVCAATASIGHRRSPSGQEQVDKSHRIDNTVLKPLPHSRDVGHVPRHRPVLCVPAH